MYYNIKLKTYPRYIKKSTTYDIERTHHYVFKAENNLWSNISDIRVRVVKTYEISDSASTACPLWHTDLVDNRGEPSLSETRGGTRNSSQGLSEETGGYIINPQN